MKQMLREMRLQNFLMDSELPFGVLKANKITWVTDGRRIFNNTYPGLLLILHSAQLYLNIFLLNNREWFSEFKVIVLMSHGILGPRI